MFFSPSHVDTSLPLSFSRFTPNTNTYTRPEHTSISKPLSTETETPPQLRPILPLHSAAFQLEKLLLQDDLNRNRRWTDYHSKTSEIVKKWLVNSAGAGGLATLADIHFATVTLLDPNDKLIASERNLLLLTTRPSAERERGENLRKRNNHLLTKSPPSFTNSFLQKSSREIGSWLLSLAVNLLWKEAKYTDALKLCSKAFVATNLHINHEKKEQNTDSMNPFIGRLGWCQSDMTSRCVKSADETLKTSGTRIDKLRKQKAIRAMIVNLMLSEQKTSTNQKHSTCTTQRTTQRTTQCTTQRNGIARFLYPHLN